MTDVVCPLCKPHCSDREAFVSDGGTTICEAGSGCTTSATKFLHALADYLLNQPVEPMHGISLQ